MFSSDRCSESNTSLNWLKTKFRLFYESLYNFKNTKAIDMTSTLQIGSFCGFNIAYRKGTADEPQIACSFDKDIFFPQVPEYQPSDGDIIIDIGAHIGTFSLLASKLVKSGKVFAIEPCEDSFNFLRINIALNNSNNIALYHMALSDKKGNCTLYYDTGNWGHSTIKALSSQSETVESITLADFLDKNNISKCHFMKLNCEGAEFPILLSTSKDILSKFNIILALYHCDLWAKNTEKDLLSHLQSCGFKTILRNVTKKRGWIIAVNQSVQQANNELV